MIRGIVPRRSPSARRLGSRPLLIGATFVQASLVSARGR
jgi:hypothetical protein